MWSKVGVYSPSLGYDTCQYKSLHKGVTGVACEMASNLVSPPLFLPWK